MLERSAERAGRDLLKKFSWVFLVLGNVFVAVSIALAVSYGQTISPPEMTVPSTPVPVSPSPSPSLEGQLRQ